MARRSSLDLISIMKEMEDMEGLDLSDSDDVETGGGTGERADGAGDEDEGFDGGTGDDNADVYTGEDDDVGEEDELAEIHSDEGGSIGGDDDEGMIEGEGEEAYSDEFTPALLAVEENTEISLEEEELLVDTLAHNSTGAGEVSVRPLGPLYEAEGESSSNYLDLQRQMPRRDEENLGYYYEDYEDMGDLSRPRTSDSSRMLESDAVSGLSSDNNVRKRQSFASVRSSVGHSSEADLSTSSAPATGTIPDSLERRTQSRRITISVPKQGIKEINAASLTNNPPRRASRYRSIRASGISNLTDDSCSSTGSSTGTFLQSIRVRGPTPRRSSSTMASRRSGAMSLSDSAAGGPLGMAAAVDRLGTHEMNTDWENAAAAAAVVAATTQAPARNYVQFRNDEHVLVLLNLLNITNRQDDKAQFTIEPVNKHGFPSGEGKTEEERRGPWSFVLCQVCKVHFDEDERYYTVRRADTGSEQRADPGWMQPIEGSVALDAAMKAAERTERAEADSPGQRHAEQDGVCNCLEVVSAFARNNLIPCYKSSRVATKRLLENILRGSKGYSCRFKLSFINFLVLCSFVYLFIEPFTIAFLPASLDYSAAIMELVVWSILVLELVFEYAIRPAGYHRLIKSDKAYAPSTARHINRFHLVCEFFALLLFIPQFSCIVNPEVCGERAPGSLSFAALLAVLGTSKRMSSLGRFIIGLSFLRVFGLVRHWKKMWINDTFYGANGPENSFLRRVLLLGKSPGPPMNWFKRKSKVDTDLNEGDSPGLVANDTASDEDKKLQMNATIGTALMVVNSHRALFLFLLIMTVFPVIYLLPRTNNAGTKLVELLQENNLAANTTADCSFLKNAVQSWLRGSAAEHITFDIYHPSDDENVNVLWAQVLPVRCAWQTEYPYQARDGVITHCRPPLIQNYEPCALWNTTAPATPKLASPDYFADEMGIRPGAISDINMKNESVPAFFNGSLSNKTFYVRVIFDENSTLSFSMTSLFILLVVMLGLTLFGLSTMRSDAQRLVLDPLQRMLRIVIRYAENPLAPTPTVSRKPKTDNPDSKSTTESREELGNYETEQLITAISKIADLLRKCWGVAGAGIISSNLARTKAGKTVVFNPTVPGKRVYALFGFIAINDFSMLLTALENDVMVLINDVARVVHDEVYRWALGDSGQCNKNLGPAFLMVFRIGDFTEVHDKKKRATDVVFNSQMTRNARLRRRSVLRKGSAKSGRAGRHDNDNLQLASLPGIQTFSDRALLGLLKSFAALHRDHKMQEWEKDFRLGAGVGSFTTSVIYGMDAGWAVEGAVGSDLKIDATYLSPHVNMASRMMSATKQYGVTILLSQAVEELLSRQAREKLRHLDTVYVKGSSVAQRIFTYDARYEGVDFFLFDRLPDQADRDAELYTPMVWNTDQDLRAMRQHVTDEFMERFKEGLDQYIEGDWTTAVETLQKADELMIEAVMEEGYVEYDLSGLEQEVFNRKTKNDEVIRIRNEFGDGASKCLIQYMQRRKCVPPPDWQGVRKLLSK